jgi:hypothetical protein
VTLALGYTFLWVDSLCIIQNEGHPDWEHEARLMATVYGNADCNLAFLFPSCTPESTPVRSDPRDWNPCILREATPTCPGVCIQLPTSLLRQIYHNNQEKDWLVQRNWPLFGRAWTFQEYLLCPRTLLLGHRNLMFQCSRHFYDELLGPIASGPPEVHDTTEKRGRDYGKTRYFPASLRDNVSDVSEDALMSSPRALGFAIDWQALFDEYRTRELRFAKDRVVAFAGVARAFANLCSLTYLAGCWAEYFPLTMLWYVDRKWEATVRRAGPVVVRSGVVEYPVCVHERADQDVPSWSQFSASVYTHHQTFFMFSDDELGLRGFSNSVSPVVSWDDIYWAKLQAVGFRGQTEEGVPESGFFDFAGLEVELTLPILPVRISWPKDLDERFECIRSLDVADAELQWTPDFTYYPDIPSQEAPSPPRNGVLALVAEFQICRVAGVYNVHRRCAGLVLVRAQKAGRWRRVGAWKLTIKICYVSVKRENIKRVAARWKEYRMWDVGEKWKMETVVLI